MKNRFILLKAFILTLCSTILLSCGNEERNALKRSYKLADKNRYELRNVLEHYDHPQDSLKLRAARFLIGHMWCHRSINITSIEGHDNLFETVESSFIRCNQHSVLAFRSVYDSLRFTPPASLSGTNDCRVINANYLIMNIDFAFKVWKKAPWTKNVSFDDFCEYVLPYHLQLEPIELWRPGFYNRFYPICFQATDVSDLTKVFSAVQLNMYKTARVENSFEEIYPTPMGVSDMLVAEMGSCIQTNIFRIMALRSVGIPVSMDYVPHWGDYGGHHEKVRLITKKPDRLLTNANSSEYVGDVFDAINLVGKDECAIDSMVLPEWLTVHFNKRVPKIFRSMWSEQPDVTRLLASANADEIYPGWSDLYRKDVTDEYLVNSDVRVSVGKVGSKKKLLYVCVFDRDRWAPVAVTGIEKDGRAFFLNLGRNIVYLPMVCEDGHLLPVSSPFFISLDGRICNLRQHPSKNQKVTLRSKYPLFVNIANRALKMQGGVFQGANRVDFSDSVTLYRVTKCPFDINSVDINTFRSFRYFRFLPAIQKNCCVGELSFYALKGKDTVRIEGRIIDSDNAEAKELQKAFDGNFVSYYENGGVLNAWIGVDAGKVEQLVRIDFCPRGDGNGIIPSYSYELFYFDGGWRSLGSQIAKGPILVYPKVPTGTLLWLKCQTEGKEERIFTYENGKQVWW